VFSGSLIYDLEASHNASHPILQYAPLNRPTSGDSFLKLQVVRHVFEKVRHTSEELAFLPPPAKRKHNTFQSWIWIDRCAILLSDTPLIHSVEAESLLEFDNGDSQLIAISTSGMT
jgi:hypothetical protein